MPIHFQFAKDWQKRGIFESVIEVVSENFGPDDIFSEDELARWALDNGFMYVKDCEE